MAILQCFKSLIIPSLTLRVFIIPWGGAGEGVEGASARFPYLIRVLDDDPVDGALQGRRKRSEITALTPPTPFLAELSPSWSTARHNPSLHFKSLVFLNLLFAGLRESVHNCCKCSRTGYKSQLDEASWIPCPCSSPSLLILGFYVTHQTQLV